MAKRLQRILSFLCVMAMVFGCLSFAALAEETSEVRIITAEWDDENDYDAKRPGSVQMTIGGTTVTLSDENNWTAEAAAPAGAEWTLAEVDGYARSVRGTDVTIVTYTHKVAKTVVAGKVVWNDSDNAAGLRPSSVQLRLLADGSPYGAAMNATEGGGWSVAWENLPRTKRGETAEITYSVQEVVPDGYTASVDGMTVTNTLQTGGLTLKASVTAPEGADVSGLKLTVTGPDPKMPVTLTYGQLSGGAYDFGQVLPGAYVLQEENADSLVEGYVMDPESSRVGDAVIVKAGESAELYFRYVYREPVAEEPNEDPKASTGNLTFEIDGPDPRMPMTITYSMFTDGKYELDDLVPGTYYVIERNAETLVNAYTLTSDSVTGLSITVGKDGAVAKLFNKYVPAPTPEPDAELIDIPVTKTWNDNNNEDGNRPESVTVVLYADGVEVAQAEISEETGWTWTFTDLPRYHEDGTEINYTVNERPVVWYAAVVNGYNITNVYEPEVTSISVRKEWLDNENAAELRPTSIAVTLLPVGKVYILNEENGWSITVDNLPTKINGESVTYSWAEQETLGYKLKGIVIEGAMTIFTNQINRIPETPDGKKPPKTPKGKFEFFEDYRTALGLDTIINHVGDCFD